MEYMLFAVAAVGLALAVLVRQTRRHRRRRASLREDTITGGYVWVGFDGLEHRSPIHPAAPDGAWTQERSQAWWTLSSSHDSDSFQAGGETGGGDGGGH